VTRWNRTAGIVAGAVMSAGVLATGAFAGDQLGTAPAGEAVSSVTDGQPVPEYLWQGPGKVVPQAGPVDGLPAPMAPQLPADPKRLADSGLPAVPGLTELPGVSQLPGLSELPGLPRLPGLSELPARPDLPGLSDLPARPDLPSLSDLPARPELPSLQDLPAVPSSQLPLG